MTDDQPEPTSDAPQATSPQLMLVNYVEPAEGQSAQWDNFKRVGPLNIAAVGLVDQDENNVYLATRIVDTGGGTLLTKGQLTIPRASVVNMQRLMVVPETDNRDDDDHGDPDEETPQPPPPQQARQGGNSAPDNSGQGSRRDRKARQRRLANR